MGMALRYIPGSTKFKNQDEMGAVILQRRLERTVAMNKPLTAAAVQVSPYIYFFFLVNTLRHANIFKYI